jgi:hypothetical protein
LIPGRCITSGELDEAVGGPTGLEQSVLGTRQRPDAPLQCRCHADFWALRCGRPHSGGRPRSELGVRRWGYRGRRFQPSPTSLVASLPREFSSKARSASQAHTTPCSAMCPCPARTEGPTQANADLAAARRALVGQPRQCECPHPAGGMGLNLLGGPAPSAAPGPALEILSVNAPHFLFDSRIRCATS